MSPTRSDGNDTARLGLKESIALATEQTATLCCSMGSATFQSCWKWPALSRDVEAELAWNPTVSSTAVGVAVKDGVVTMTGHLDTFAEKHAVERIASRGRRQGDRAGTRREAFAGPQARRNRHRQRGGTGLEMENLGPRSTRYA